MEIVITDFNMGLNVLKFLQKSSRVTKKTDFHEKKITSIQEELFF